MKIRDIIVEAKAISSPQEMEDEIIQDIQRKDGGVAQEYNGLDVKRAAQIAFGTHRGGEPLGTSIEKALNQQGFTLQQDTSSQQQSQTQAPAPPGNQTAGRTKVDTRGRKLKHDRYYGKPTMRNRASAAKSKVGKGIEKHIKAPARKGADWVDKWLK